MNTPTQSIPGNKPGPAPAVANQVPVAPGQDSLVGRALAVLRGEPILFVTLGYAMMSFIGLWSSYWFFRMFKLPILAYLQVSDFLVAGFRDPAYFAWLAGYSLVLWLVSWPMFFWRRHPQRVDEYRTHWWGRLVFLELIDPARPQSRYAWAPETALAFGLFWGGIWVLMAYVTGKAQGILDGGGDRVSVTLADQTKPLVDEARLLGTSSGYVFLYWPGSGRTEAVSAGAIGRIESLPRRKPVASTRPAK